jgi:hypothetical protein
VVQFVQPWLLLAQGKMDNPEEIDHDSPELVRLNQEFAPFDPSRIKRTSSHEGIPQFSSQIGLRLAFITVPLSIAADYDYGRSILEAYAPFDAVNYPIGPEDRDPVARRQKIRQLGRILERTEIDTRSSLLWDWQLPAAIKISSRPDLVVRLSLVKSVRIWQMRSNRFAWS